MGNLYFFQLAFAEYILLSWSHVCLDYLPLCTSLLVCLSISSVSSVQSLSYVQSFATLWTAARQASLSFTISWSFLKLISIESVMPSNHLILCHSLLIPSKTQCLGPRNATCTSYFTDMKQHIHKITSVQFSCSVVSNSLQSHGLQHARPPCPSPTLRVYSNSCPLGRWCHPTTSSFVT